MRVLMLTAHPGIAGPLPKIAPLVVGAMRRLGCTVDTVPWSHRAEHESLAVKLVSRGRDLWRIRRHLRRQHVDVLLVTTTHDWPALLRDIPLLALTGGLCGARVLHFHGSMVDALFAPGNRLLKICSRWLVSHSDAVLVLSKEERDLWRLFCPGVRFDVVVNPFVPSEAACRRDPREHGDPAVILFVGRLIPQKGVFDLVEAMRAVLEQQRCVLRIVGQGSHEQALRNRIAELGLGASVLLTGYIGGEALGDLYASSDVFALPTYFGEGFPTVITEAMAFGLPIVTTPIRGAADQLAEGENVLFVPPHRPPDLAKALLRLLNDHGLCTDMGKRNQAKVLDFAPEVVVPQYVEIMRDLVGAHAGDHADRR